MPILAAIGEDQQSKRILSISYKLAERYDERLVVLQVVPTEEFNEYRASLDEILEFGHIIISQEQDSAARLAYRVLRIQSKRTTTVLRHKVALVAPLMRFSRKQRV